jgi:REP element-mobilizing transposase RayT
MPRIYSPRLKNFDYRGPLAAHLVFVTRQRGAIFTDERAASICVSALEQAALKHQASIHAYCVMPDHVHALVEIPEDERLGVFVRLFKTLSGFRLKQLLGAEVWQTSYYDHILRRDEDILDVARYIWENPVEDGLVADFLDYCFSGPREMMISQITG